MAMERSSSSDSLASVLSADCVCCDHHSPKVTTYASPSILQVRLPPPVPTAKKSKKAPTTCLISHTPAPAEHFHARYPTTTERPKLERTASTLSTTSCNLTSAYSTQGGLDLGVGNDSTVSWSTTSSSIQFAPLPPGRSRFRSNSLTIGVAARAKMIASQGSAPTQASVNRAKYAGPQQVWQQTGGVCPPDVYTYKDAASALTKVWSKLKKKPSASTAQSADALTAAALAIEKEGKGEGRNDDERIEDISEEIEDSVLLSGFTGTHFDEAAEHAESTKMEGSPIQGSESTLSINESECVTPPDHELQLEDLHIGKGADLRAREHEIEARHALL